MKPKFRNIKKTIQKAAIAATLATGLSACKISPDVTTKSKLNDIFKEKVITELNHIKKVNNEWNYYNISDTLHTAPYSLTTIKPPSLEIKNKILKKNKEYLSKFPKKKIIALWDGKKIISLDLNLLRDINIKKIQTYVSKEDSIRIESIFFDLAKDQFPANKYIYSQSNVQNATVPKIDSTYNVFEKRRNYLKKLSNYNLADLMTNMKPEHYKIIHNAFIKMPTDVQSYIITATKNASIDLEYRELKKYAKNKKIIQWSIIAPLAVFGLLLGCALHEV